MVFPKLSFWSNRDPGDAAGRIDRALNDRNHRLSVGLAVSSAFSSVRGSLVVAQGNGKYIRIRHVVSDSAPIPQAIADGCLEFVQGRSSHLGELGQLLSDLAEIHATVVDKLKVQAGKYVDRVLAVAVSDPGYWHTDFDGRVSYSSLCNPTRLAELCGVSVIDAFPERDLAVNGRGTSLESLPLWILFSDRSPRIASQARGLIFLSEESAGYSLPASDGLDANVPEIGMARGIGLRFLSLLGTADSIGLPKQDDLNQLKPGGEAIPELKSDWERALGNHLASQQSNANLGISLCGDMADLNTTELELELSRIAKTYLDQSRYQLSQIVTTGIQWLVESVASRLFVADGLKIDQLLVACPEPVESTAIEHLKQVYPGATISNSQESGIGYNEIESVVAALLGLFHIDQMPANIPWHTGADSQRILGRITPGRPSSWRQLIRSMADFHPAPMKLKDAI